MPSRANSSAGGAQLAADDLAVGGQRLDEQPDHQRVLVALLDAPHLGLLEDVRALVEHVADATRWMTCSAWSMSVSPATSTSSSARAQCWLLLPTRTIAPLGTCQTVPSAARSRVVRSDTASTVPVDLAVEVDDVADAELVLGEDEQARQEVLDERLRAEAQRDADDARAGEQRRDVDAELADSTMKLANSRITKPATLRRMLVSARMRCSARRLVSRRLQQRARRAPAHRAHPLAHDAAREAAQPALDHAPDEPVDDQRAERDQHDRQRRAEDEVGDLGQRAVVRALEDLPADGVGIASRTRPAARPQRCLRARRARAATLAAAPRGGAPRPRPRPHSSQAVNTPI